MRKVICIAAKIKSTLRELVENKLSGHEIIWLEELDSRSRIEAIKRADIMLASLLTAELSAEEKSLLGSLEMIQTMSAGIDQVDFSLFPADICLYSNTGGWAHAMAEHAFAMALACTRMLRPQTEALRNGNFDIYGYPMRLLSNCRVLVVGWGGIGSSAGKLFHLFGCSVEAVGRTAPVDTILTKGWAMQDLLSALSQADIVLLSIPATNLTRRIINAQTLSVMKEDAILINVARAELIDKQALEEHLQNHSRFFAALDVWWQERRHYPAAGETLLKLPNVIGSAHNSYISPTANEEAAANAIDNIIAFIEGKNVKGRAQIREYLKQQM